MRNYNVLKYRKLLSEIQQEISKLKSDVIKNSTSTDFQRGEIQGQMKAYKKVLKYLDLCVEDADIDWDYIESTIRYNEDFLKY